MFITRYQNILDQCSPYIFCYGPARDNLNMRPFGLEIDPKNFYDCTRTDSSDFFNLLTKLDQLSFGDQQMGMDRWVFFDCSAMPGAIIGLGIDREKLSDDILKKLDIPKNYKGLIPISFYIAIPMIKVGCWFGHNLSSMNRFFNLNLSGLGLLTKAIGIEVLKIETLFGATQWTSPAINLHVTLSSMDLISAFTPNHTYPYSLSYKSTYLDLKNIFSKEPIELKELVCDEWLCIDDVDRIKQLQLIIEKGQKIKIIGKSEIKGEKIKYPLKFI